MIRLFISDAIFLSSVITLSNKHSHYLINVMRRRAEDEIVVFNGIDGEWLCRILSIEKKAVCVLPIAILRAQFVPLTRVRVAFAPVKNYSASLIVQKITELGVNDIYPVITDRSVVTDVNLDKLQNAAIEASEQSERVDVPVIHQIQSLKSLSVNLGIEDIIIFCDEKEHHVKILDVLSKKKYCSITVMIGPEGGFTDAERLYIKSLKSAAGVCLNGNILRSETAVLAAVSVIKAAIL